MTDLHTAFSSESGRTYQLDKLIGKGGFGEVYLATPTPQDGLPSQVCIKITERLSAWLREAYFAELLFREPRALRVYDRFAEVENGRARYCIALEYAVHGDLGVWLQKKGPQSERFVRREIAAVLSALDILHRGQAMHRDLTPFNVFVCEDEQLKLGDFGIAMHQRSQRGVTADAFNVFNAPADRVGKSSPLAAARRYLSDRTDSGDAPARRHLEPDEQSRCPTPPVQRSPQGSHLPLPRRTGQALPGGR